MPKTTERNFCSRAAGLLAITIFAIVPVTSARPTVATQGWSTYKNERFGFQLSYPGGLFKAAETPNPESGAMWTSTDNGVRLIATAAPNETGETLQSYKDFVMRESYADAKFDYQPSKD